MKYTHVRPTIRSGDLLAFSHGSWRSWNDIKVNLVRIFTRSTYSHVGLAWVVAGRVFVLEAVKPKVRIYPLSQSGAFYLVGQGAPWRSTTEEFAMAMVGYDYSEFDAISAYFERLEPGKVCQCAAYVREVMLKDSIDLGCRLTPDAIVQEALKRSGGLVFVEPGDASN